MLGSRKSNAGTIDSLIGAGTQIRGDVAFKGGLRIDGQVIGRVAAEEGGTGMLVVSEHARIEGEVRATHVVVNGTVIGPIQADELLELQAKARVTGDIRYQTLEIHHGAVIDGSLSHLEAGRGSLLKLAASNE